MTELEKSIRRMHMAIHLQRPDRLPLAPNDWKSLHYSVKEYYWNYADDVKDATEREAPQAGETRVSADGKRRYTREGNLWALGDKDLFRTSEDVLNIDIEALLPVEPIPYAKMRVDMTRLYQEVARERYAVPWYYPTLVTAATQLFDWQPFLMAAADDPQRFGEICDRFGERAILVAKAWAQIEGVDLIVIHDDIAATRGPILSPKWLRTYAFPWHRKIFEAIHALGKKVLYISDGNVLPVLDDIVANGPDGLYIESTSMDPAEFMRRAGRDKIYMLKSDARNIDHGTPEDVKQELQKIRELHAEYPGIIMYRGGDRQPECVEAFQRYYEEFLVYEH